MQQVVDSSEPHVGQGQTQILEAPPLTQAVFAGQLMLQQQMEPISVAIPGGMVLGEAQSEIVDLTRSVISYHRSAALSCAAMCIALYRLYQAFGAATGQTVADRTQTNVRVRGWPEWVAANFEHLGLNRARIDDAIRSGQVMLTVCEPNPDSLQAFSRLSRAAIFSLGVGSEANQVTLEVKQILESSDKTLTAKEIAEMRQNIARLNDEKNQLSQELNNHAQATARMSQQLMDSEQLTIELRDRNAELEERAKTPVESLVTKLPPGAQTEQDAINMLSEKKRTLRREVEQMEGRLETVRQEAQTLERRVEGAKTSERSLSGLRDDVGQLMIKYSVALLDSMQKSSATSREELKQIATSLRGWANAMDPVNQF